MSARSISRLARTGFAAGALTVALSVPALAMPARDSNGIRSAHAAGMAVVAVPMRAFPPAPEALALASRTVDGIAAVTPEVVAEAFAAHAGGGVG